MKIYVSAFLLVLFSSCKSVPEKENKQFYKSVYYFLKTEFNTDELFVSEEINNYNFSDFGKIGYSNLQSEKKIQILERIDSLNKFSKFNQSNLYKWINYQEPKSKYKPIVFFSKPINDSLICEVFPQYQNSKNLNDYTYFEQSRVFLFSQDSGKIKLVNSFKKSR